MNELIQIFLLDIELMFILTFSKTYLSLSYFSFTHQLLTLIINRNKYFLIKCH